MCIAYTQFIKHYLFYQLEKVFFHQETLLEQLPLAYDLHTEYHLDLIPEIATGTGLRQLNIC